MDLTARRPRTGELLSTVKFMVRTLAAAGELQRDLQRELTYDGLRAAEAAGRWAGAPPRAQGLLSPAEIERSHRASKCCRETDATGADQ
ncbi:hypothetical protein [Streptomyces rugosispiralis]|uniref:Uncharacterized protein n=1 Tax=Streptomyces rugosispiralis TaxID=2967341 RepID=A0ABT1V590_9ACTN|nr:hypothetical protein [Streptomyces rugosispiralis]MCQ8192178.1 hypothetical protein [Streptomyces rugosispiralis]